MKLFILSFLLLTFFNGTAQECYLGKQYPVPQLSAEIKRSHVDKLEKALADFRRDSSNADNIIWLGRRQAYLGEYEKAIAIFSRGIELHPSDARLYRHRGHRYLTLRCFDKAIDDFKEAAKLTRGKPDEIEPDGLPNAKNIPTSTLQSNIWYHLGLAYFIKADYKKALKAYKECITVSTNKDMYVATANWLNLAYRKFKKYPEAMALYGNVPQGELIENKDYLLLLEMYNQKRLEKEVDEYAARILPADRSIASATLQFGIGYYCLLYGYKEKAKEYFANAMASGQWSSFGYIAAEAELARTNKQ
jgi:hypothetical protein